MVSFKSAVAVLSLIPSVTARIGGSNYPERIEDVGRMLKPETAGNSNGNTNSGCHDCSCFTCGDVEHTDGKYLITVNHCKGDSISWMCCVGYDGKQGNCDIAAGGCSGTQEGAKCNTVDSALVIEVSDDAKTFTINTHDGKTAGTDDAVNSVCGGNGNQGGSCAAKGGTAHCLITFDIAEDCGGVGRTTDAPTTGGGVVTMPPSMKYPDDTFPPTNYQHLTHPPTHGGDLTYPPTYGETFRPTPGYHTMPPSLGTMPPSMHDYTLPPTPSHGDLTYPPTSGGETYPPTTDGGHKVWVCHGTSSDKNPYEMIEIDYNALEDHLSDSHNKNKKYHDVQPGNYVTIEDKKDGNYDIYVDENCNVGEGEVTLPPTPHGDHTYPPTPGGGDLTYPPTHGDHTLPPTPGGGDLTYPPTHGDHTLPPTPGGETYPPTHGGDITTPPTHMGDTIPPTQGETYSPTMTPTHGYTFPPTVGFVTMPPTPGGQTSPPTTGGGHKVWICHGTSSDKNPYEMIEIDEHAVDDHLGEQHNKNKKYHDVYPGSTVTVEDKKAGSYEIYVDDKCNVPGGQGSASGDPHVKTWDGQMFDFHGECDLVLVDSPKFDNGKGLKIHIRTKMVTWWSYIETAVLKIGEDTIEVQGGKNVVKYWVNGVPGTLTDSGMLESQVGGYDVKFRNVSPRQKSFRLQGLPSGFAIGFDTFNDFVRVNVRSDHPEYLSGALGLMGQYPSGKKVARDGKTIMEDTDAFGQEWQVLATEEMLFHDVTGPQAPESCRMPTVEATESRRLAESTIEMEDAKRACAHVSDPEDFDACVFDVLALNDMDMAGAY